MAYLVAGGLGGFEKMAQLVVIPQAVVGSLTFAGTWRTGGGRQSQPGVP